MIAWFLSFIIPRGMLQAALIEQWRRRSLDRGERIRFDHFGATGNSKHHPYSWAE